MTLGELIEKLGGKLAQGSPELDIDGVSSSGFASPPSWYLLKTKLRLRRPLNSSAARRRFDSRWRRQATRRIRMHCGGRPSAPMVCPARPSCSGRFRRPQASTPAPSSARSVELGEGVSVGPAAVIGDDVLIGAGTHIEAGAVVGQGVRIGRLLPNLSARRDLSRNHIGKLDHVHAGAVLGADGFGYVRDPATGAYTQFPQQGALVIEDDVEIGANCTIDRGALGATRVRRGAKFDNLVHVGHNCDIGEDAILVALTGISGSSTIGNGAVLAGQVGIGDHVHVGPGVILGGQAGVFSGKTVTNEGLKPGTVHWGTPARPLQQVLREQATLARLAKKRGNKGQGRDEERRD